ncbi:hypothetical protein PCCS19_07740 [Paenibacillus sp. CCS19]|uniref:peptidase MA family metallohydrolase n=1 Tax=Paenibacillus sp. CCS19 TaxID=3158387 RepID=UPI00256DF7E7|nr:hypothetical protein [Paenibacillus cellulosilyticus]GMK37720.1 hypothetical protein PCCS19_07740 [Paenibacillus cellulosilyticus]
MKLRQRFFIFALIGSSPLLIVLPACSSMTDNLPLIQETSHARFYSPNEHAVNSVASLAETFEANYNRLIGLFPYEAKDKTIIHVYTDRDAYQAMIGRDTEGTYDARDGIIKVYTPADLSDEIIRHNFNEQIIHEFVHLLIQQINPEVGHLKWLDEGIAYYAAGQLEEEMQSKTSYFDIPTFEQFADHDYFNKAHGAAYFYSGLMVKYIVDTYGIVTLNDMIRQPEQAHIQQLLTMPIDQFFKTWHDAMLSK